MENAKISKLAIKTWFENYHETAMCAKPIDRLPVRGGQKPYDGIGAWRVNKIMLQAAIKESPPALKNVIIARYIKRLPYKETLQLLGISKDRYYKRCDWAIDYIYYSVNNDINGKSELLLKIDKAIQKKRIRREISK